MQETFKLIVEKLEEKQNGTIIDAITHIIEFIRPQESADVKTAVKNIRRIIAYLQKHTDTTKILSDALHEWLLQSKISSNLSSLGILSRDGFTYELKNRFYNKFLPAAPQEGDFKYLFTALFYKKDDHLWVTAVDDTLWRELFALLLHNESCEKKTKDYLFEEILYAIEILSIWIASEEFDDNFVRIDRTLLNRDSAFIEFHRSISDFITTIQASKIDINTTELDFQHTKVILDQCREQVEYLRKKSIDRGISVALTYELERLEQIIRRVEDLLALIKKFDTDEFYKALIDLFKKSVVYNATKNSIYEIYNQNIKILAKSITNSASEHGEHYLTNNKQEYIKMFFSASGAGVVIAFMALCKIFIYQLELQNSVQILLASLNYGLGFVFIHILGFTIATKQPAMTASTFAKAVEKEQNNRANQLKLVELIFQVSRSQFAAVTGNVLLALSIAFFVGFLFFSNDYELLTQEQRVYYLNGIYSPSSLFYAGIAGVWLFCSGIIAGYFDNRANYLNLKERYLHSPLLKKYLSTNIRKKIASYLHENHGAIAGNFFFGVLLGITPFLGILFHLPLEIRHVAFSTATLGYCSANLSLGVQEFFLALTFVFLIGFVNLTVSFILALNISLQSRDAYFGSVVSFLKLLALKSFQKPKDLFFPSAKEENNDK